MNVCWTLRAPGLLTALAAVTLPLFTGCATMKMTEEADGRSYDSGGVVSAYSLEDELVVAYLAIRPGRQTRVAWFAGKALRDGEVSSTGEELPADFPVFPVRLNAPRGGLPRECVKGFASLFVSAPLEDIPGRLPTDAQPVLVVRLLPVQSELPSLPPGIPMQVCYRLAEGRSPQFQEAFVLLRAERGAVVRRRLILPLDRARAWWLYPLLPVTLAVDIATIPILVAAAIWGRS